jgi:DNA mismatch repair protein MutL
LPIRVLDENVSSAIAAGEVVERPESVVKELIENSVDSGADRIEVTITAGGKKLIQVRDNGSGIPAAEVPLSVARHATSKLTSTEDLFNIQTLGFRGEALTSIGAVSRMEIVTRTQNEQVGSQLRVSGGEVKDLQPMGTPVGTMVQVRDLFSERRRIHALIARYAFAYPHIAFLLQQEGRTALQTTGNGDRREVLAEIFGLDTAKGMIALPVSGPGLISVTGFISPPTIHRGTRREITLFVQGRRIHDPSLSAAVLQAYHGLLMVGRFPVAIVLIELPPDSVDLNVHPAKAEVRFKDPQMVFTVVQRVLRGTLLNQTPAPVIEMPTTWQQLYRDTGSRTPDPAWDLLQRNAEETTKGDIQPGLTNLDVPLLRSVGQVGAAYLVAEGPDGLYLIDQHAAHERVLFESLMTLWKTGKLESQQLLVAETVELETNQAGSLIDQIDALQSLGFEVEHFGGSSFKLRAIPAFLIDADPEGSLRSVVDDLEEDETALMSEVEARIAARVCKRAAIKSGQILSLEEQRQLIRDLESCESPRTCPHGRPTMIHLSVDALERQFGRRG